MRNILFAAVAVASITLGFNIVARADGLNFNANVNEPHTNLPPDQWVEMIKTFVNAKPLIGKPQLYMVNATGQVFVAVTCDKWQLVGNKPSNAGAPTELPAWTVTWVDATSFDGYCGNGVFAMTASGDVYHGALSNFGQKSDNIKNTTFVTFTPATKKQ